MKKQGKHTHKSPTLSKKNITRHPTDINFFHSDYFLYFVLFILTIIVYGWTYTFTYSLSDEYVLSAVNSLENNFRGFLSIFKETFAGSDFRPVTVLSFWLERFLFRQINPHISHAVNFFIYWLILLKIYDFIKVVKFYDNEKKLILLGFLCAVFYLIHPNHVSVVANIKSRDNLLSMLFGLMATIQLIKLYDERRIKRLFLSMLYIIMALLSKIDSYIFILTPFLVFLFYRDVNLKKIAYIFVATVILFIISFEIRDLVAIGVKDTMHMNMAFDKNPLVTNNTFLNRLSLSLTCLYYYLKFLFFPTGYHFIFGYNQIPVTSLFSIKNIIGLSTILLLLFFSIRVYTKNKIYLFCIFFFILAIMYALNFFNLVANIVMDRYNFIASLGFCMALAALFIDVYDTSSFKIFKKPVVFLLIFTFTIFTFYRTKDWRNIFTLVEHDMPYLTNSVNANRIAGAAYINEALHEEMKPNFNKVYADSMINLGEMYTLRGIELYDNEVELWNSKGLCSFYKKNFREALTSFQKCKQIDSSYLSAINYIGFTYWKLNNIDSAYYYFDYVIKREPHYGYSANNLISMLLANNRRTEADSLIRQLKIRFPDDLWLNERVRELYGN